MPVKLIKKNRSTNNLLMFQSSSDTNNANFSMLDLRNNTGEKFFVLNLSIMGQT